MKKKEKTVATVRARVARARAVQVKRQGVLNGEVPGKKIRCAVRQNNEIPDLIEKLMNQMKFSVRGIDKILRVAQTICDLEGTQNIEPRHLMEAAQYKMPKTEEK